MTGEVKPRAAALLRLAAVIIVFPAVMVYVFPRLNFAAAFLEGDRSQWLPFWAAAAAFEWVLLIIVVLTYGNRGRSVEEIGFPEFRPGTLLLAIFVVGAAVWAAIVLPGVSENTLSRMPYGATLFLPPAEMGTRLFWVVMAFTAAVCEETLFRGVAITELRRLTGSLWIPVLVSSLAFAFFHGGAEQGVAMFAIRFLIAVILAGLFVWRKKLTSAMFVHFILDASSLTAV